MKKDNQKVNWVNFLHIYQPPNQDEGILEKVVNESYHKIFDSLKENSNAKLVLNINGSLTEQLAEKGHDDLVNQIKELGDKGQIEFTASAKFHPLLDKIKKKEIVRQVEINNQTNKEYFGSSYQPEGFFPPELVCSKKIAKIIKSLGYSWMVADDIAYSGESHDLPCDKLYEIEGIDDFKIVFRNRRLSNAVLSGVIRDEDDFIQAIGKERITPQGFIVTLMDGETFGHHRPGLEKLLFDLYDSEKVESLLLDQALTLSEKKEKINPVKSNWSSTEEELEAGLPFARWYDPENKIQMIQWKFLNRILKRLHKLDKKDRQFTKLRKKTDKALSSDQFWWASARPWWSIEMIEKGAHRMLSIWQELAENKKEQEWGEERYNKIISLAFKWQRTGKVKKMRSREDLPHKRSEKKIPLKKRVEEDWFKGLIRQLKKAEKKAVKARKYEKAIMWRDAIHKLKEEEDAYDAVCAADLLREKENISNLDKVIEDDIENLKKN